MAENEFIYKLTVDTSGTNTDDARRALESLKKQILETEGEIKKLQAGLKDGSKTINEAAGPLSQHEARLKALRTTYNETARAAVGLEGFTQKIGKQFREAIGPINDLVGRLGPVGNVINQVSTKLGDIGKTSAQSAEGIGKLNAFTGGIARAAGGAVLAVGALAGGIAALGVGLASSVQAYDESTKAQRQLEVALGGTSRALLDQASALQKTTGFADEAIVKGQAFAASLGLTEQEILKLTPAVIDLAAATGQDVTSAFESVATTLSGGRDALKKYGIELDGTAAKGEQVGQVIEGLTSKFGGQAEAIAAAGAGPVRQFQITVGELEETLGSIIVRGIGPFVDGLNDLVQGFNDAISPADDLNERIADSTKELRSQQTEYTSLLLKLQDANTSEQQRSNIIETLNTKYAEYLPKLVTEKTTNEELSDAIERGNGQFIARIALRSKETELTAALEKQAALEANRVDAEVKLRNALIERINAQQDGVRKADLALLNEEGGVDKLVKKYGELSRGLDRISTQVGDRPVAAPQANEIDKLAKVSAVYTRQASEAKVETDKLIESTKNVANSFGITSDLVAQATNEVGKNADAVDSYGESVKNAFAAVKDGTASIDQIKTVVKEVGDQLKDGTASSVQLGSSLASVKKALEQLPAGDATKGIRDSLIRERESLEQQIKNLEGKAVGTTQASNKAVVDSYADRVKKVIASYDLEIAAIDNAENNKLVTQIEADTRRNQALSKFLDERIKLETEAATKAAEKNGGEIPLDFKLRINGLEEEKQKVDREVERLKLEAQAKIREISGRIDLKVSADVSELEKQLSDAVAFDDLKNAFENAFADTANSVSSDVKQALLAAAQDGTIDFGGLIKNRAVPERIVNDLQRAYEKFRLETDRNRITLVRDQEQEKLDKLKKRYEELTRIVAELDQKKADPTVTLTAEEEESYTNAKKELDSLDGAIKTVTLNVKANTDELDKIGEALDKTTGPKEKKSFFADLFGITDEQAELYVNGAVDLANAVGDALFEAQQAQIQRRLDLTNQAISDERDVTLRGIEDRVNAGLITEQQAERLREKANKDAEEKRRKAAKEAVEADRKIKSSQATIAFFSELAQLGLSSRTLPPGASEIYYGIQAAISAARYAGNLAAINSTPVAANGTIVKAQDGMMAQGPSHADGGILGVVSGKPAVELEGGEAIINRRSSEFFAPLLSMINSHNGWGVPLMAAGGQITRGTALVNATYTEENLNEMLSRMTYHFGGMIPSMASGGRITRGTALVNATYTDEDLDVLFSRRMYRFGGMLPQFNFGGMIPAEGTIANRRQLEIATANSRERVVKLNGDKRSSRYTVHVDDLTRKMDGIRDAENNVTFGI